MLATTPSGSWRDPLLELLPRLGEHRLVAQRRAPIRRGRSRCAASEAVELVARLADRLAHLLRSACAASVSMPRDERARGSARSPRGARASGARRPARLRGARARRTSRATLAASSAATSASTRAGGGIGDLHASSSTLRCACARGGSRKSSRSGASSSVLGADRGAVHELGMPLHAEHVARAAPADRLDDAVGHGDAPRRSRPRPSSFTAWWWIAVDRRPRVRLG